MKKIPKKEHPTGRRKRKIALLTSLCLLTAMLPISVNAENSSAATGLCEHHTEHTAECGYVAGVEGHACEHIHDESCGYQEARECTHIHTQECGENGENCTHVHDDACGYVEGHACGHIHDENCGYVETVEGSSCTFVCDICTAETEPELETETELETGGSNLGEAILAVQVLIDALPDAEDITEDKLDEVSEQLEAIDEAKGQLTDEEREALDFTKYDAAAAKIAELLGEEGTGVPEALALQSFNMTGQPADATVKTINLNAAVLRPTDTNNKQWDIVNGNKVYFGKYNGTSVAYRVLSSPNTQTGVDDALFLDCDTVLENVKFDEDCNKNAGQMWNPNEWPGSDLEAWLNKEVSGNYNFYGNTSVFSDIEKKAIAETTLLSQTSYEVLVGTFYCLDYSAADHVFCLSAAEADGLYKGTGARKKTGGTHSSWWLRTATKNQNDAAVCIQSGGGYFFNNLNSAKYGACPALNVNLSSVLFASENRADKSSALAAVSDSTAKEWKLTLLDGDKAVNVTNGQTVTKTDNGGNIIVTVPYTYSDTNAANLVNQISVMITDKTYTDSGAQVLYYGALQGTTITAAGASNGTGTFTLPDDLSAMNWSSDYYVYIIAEAVNAADITDYASVPVLLPVAIVSDNETNMETGTETMIDIMTDTEHVETANTSGNTNDTYQIIEGADSSWKIGSSEGLTIRGNGEYSKFIGVKVDGVFVDETHYTVAEGSTIVTLKASYLNTLEPGTHTLEILWIDGSVTTTFTINAPAALKKDDVPKTGEGTPTAWLFTLVLLSGTGLLLTGKRRKKTTVE